MMRPEEQAAADERVARELQQAELGQRRPEPPRQIVQGVPVGQSTAPSTGHVVVGVTRHGGLPAQGVAAVIEQLPVAEVIVLNYRLAVSCFASVDMVITLMHVVTLVGGPSWGILSLLLLIGPICGIVSARTLNRKLVFVYLLFCFLKVACEIATAVLFGLVSMLFFLWIVFLTVVQVWITKVVLTFWKALGAVSASRRQELAKNKDVPAHMVFW